VRAGNHAKAVAEVNSLIAAEEAAAIALYDFACVYALASAAVKDAKNPDADAPRLAGEYAARGVELLRQAVAKGYKDIDHLKKDDDLKALHEREDYKKLLESLDKKEKSNP
jgi:hypothetical protein